MAAVTRLWIDGRPVPLDRPAELSVASDMRRWTLRADLPPDVLYEQPFRVSMQFADGKVISGAARLADSLGSGVVALADIEWAED